MRQHAIKIVVGLITSTSNNATPIINQLNRRCKKAPKTSPSVFSLLVFSALRNSRMSISRDGAVPILEVRLL